MNSASSGKKQPALSRQTTPKHATDFQLFYHAKIFRLRQPTRQIPPNDFLYFVAVTSSLSVQVPVPLSPSPTNSDPTATRTARLQTSRTSTFFCRYQSQFDMGSGRHTVHQKGVAHPHKKHREKQGVKAIQPILRQNLPRAGMIYPFRHSMMRSRRGDLGVSSAIKKGLGVPHTTTPVLDDVFCRVFEEATELMRNDGPGSKLKDEPIEFMRLLRKCPGLREPWLRRQTRLFTNLFLVLRCARRNWHNNPRPPFDTEQHCKTARAIDAYLAVEKLNWSSIEALGWFITRGVDIIKPEGKNLGKTAEARNTAGAKDSSAKSNADTLNLTTLELSLEEIIQGIRNLNIDVDETALTAAFAKLRIQEEARRNGNPLLDGWGERNDETDEEAEDDDEGAGFRAAT